MKKTEIEKLVSEITDFVNTYSLDQDLFNETMSHEHRTLQQSFTRLCLKWLEHVGSVDYKFDGRNEASFNTANDIIVAFRSTHECSPSQMLPLI